MTTTAPLRWLARLTPRGLLAGFMAIGVAVAPMQQENTALAVPQDPKSDASVADVDGPCLIESKGGGWTSKRVVKSGQGAAALVEPLAAANPEIEVPLPGMERPLRVRALGDPPPCIVPAQDLLLALSDLEGNVEQLIALLRAGRVVDEELNRTFGKGHVVVVGDTLDRGLFVTEILWLFYELEARARAAGGAVHFLLGNDEVMNLTGDLRNVRKKYRENAALFGENLGDLYARNTLLGRWLRMRNAIVRIGDELFVHGGVSPAVAHAESDLQKMNDTLRAAPLADTGTKPADGLPKLVAGAAGWLWYRGDVSKPIGEKEMDEVLAALNARRIVVGHTLVDKVGLALGGRVLTLDVHHAEGKSEAALRDKSGRWFRLLPDGTREKV